MKFLANRRAYHFIFAFIIISGILFFYFSCKSKSPTESASALNNQVAAQSTNNTTTSSSTTTTIKPGNSPTNTTTLITSRTLTSTSTSTSTSTTSSIPSTTTTIKKPTTTTSIGTCKLGIAKVWINDTPVPDGGAYDITYIYSEENEFKITVKFCNHGTGEVRIGTFDWGKSHTSMQASNFQKIEDNFMNGIAFTPGSCSRRFAKYKITWLTDSLRVKFWIEGDYVDSEGNYCDSYYYTFYLDIYYP